MTKKRRKNKNSTNTCEASCQDLDGFSDNLRDSLLTYIELRKRREDG